MQVYLIMNILNMYVLQCILCASDRKYFRIYGALQIIIINYYYYPTLEHCRTVVTGYKVDDVDD